MNAPVDPAAATHEDPQRLDHLQLPAHVNVWAYGAWRPGWLIGRDHSPSGWYGLVQFQHGQSSEATEWLPANRITTDSHPKSPAAVSPDDTAPQLLPPRKSS